MTYISIICNVLIVTCNNELLTLIDLSGSVVYIRYWRITNHVVVCVIMDYVVFKCKWMY